MATGPESLASRRAKRHASWKQNWAQVKRHNLVRPKSVRNRHSRRSNHERATDDDTDDSSLGDLFSDSTGVESDGRDLHNSAPATATLTTSTSSLISSSTSTTSIRTLTSTSALASTTSSPAVASTTSTTPVASTTSSPALTSTTSSPTLASTTSTTSSPVLVSSSTISSVSSRIVSTDHARITDYVTATLVEHIDVSSTWMQTLQTSSVTVSRSDIPTKTSRKKMCSGHTLKPAISSSTTSLPTGTGGLALNPAVLSSSSFSYSMPTVSLTSTPIPTFTPTSSSTIKLTLTRVPVSTKSSSTYSTTSTTKSTSLPTTLTTPLAVAAPALQTSISSSIVTSGTATAISAIHTGSNGNDSDSDNDGKTGRPPRQGLSGSHSTAAAAAATTSTISSSSSNGGLSETAEHFVISTASIASFAAICAIVWFIMRYMRKRNNGGDIGGSRGLKFLPSRRGNSSSGGDSIFGRVVSKIPYVRDKVPSQNRRWHNLEDGPDSRGPYTMSWNEKNAGAYAAPSLTSQSTGSSTASSIAPGGAPAIGGNAGSAGFTGIGPIAETSLLTPTAAQTPRRTSGISWTTSVDDSLTVGKTNSMVSDGSRNFHTQLQPMPMTMAMPPTAMTATAAVTATAAQVAAARRDSVARRDSRSSRSSGSTRSSAAFEGVSATLTEPYTTDLSYSSSFRSARAQYGGDDTLLEMPAQLTVPGRASAMTGGSVEANNMAGDYRYSELSSLSSGFGDGDIAMPLRTGDAGSRGTFLAAPGTLAVRSQRSSAATSQEPKTPPPVAMRESWSQPVVGQRDTVFTAATDDSSPARFRTVSSWVQQQTGQVRRAQRQAEKNGETHAVPDEPQLTLMMPDGEVPRPVDMSMR